MTKINKNFGVKQEIRETSRVSGLLDSPKTAGGFG
jgi:hypothetical protein